MGISMGIWRVSMSGAVAKQRVSFGPQIQPLRRREYVDQWLSNSDNRTIDSHFHSGNLSLTILLSLSCSNQI